MSDPTYADALRESRSVMKAALTQIAFFGKDEDAAKIATDVLEEAQDVFVHGVHAACD